MCMLGGTAQHAEMVTWNIVSRQVSSEWNDLTSTAWSDVSDKVDYVDVRFSFSFYPIIIIQRNAFKVLNKE